MVAMKLLRKLLDYGKIMVAVVKNANPVLVAFKCCDYGKQLHNGSV